MNFFRKMFGRNDTQPVAQEKRGQVSYYSYINGGSDVDAQSVQGIATAFSCVKYLAETLSMLPFHLYEKDGKGIKKRVRGSEFNYLFHRKPNKWQTPMEFKEMMFGHAILRGNGYAYIQRNNAGRVVQLIPLHPDRVRPFMHKGDRLYEYTPLSGGTQILFRDEIFHLVGYGSDGLQGMSVIRYHQKTFGTSEAQTDFQSNFYKNSATPSGVLSMDGHLSDQAFERLKKSWSKKTAGVDNAHKPQILEEGLKWQSISFSAEDAQLLDSQKFSDIRICQIFRVPPHKVGILDRATFSNIEHQSIEVVTDTLMPWITRFEETSNMQFISDDEFEIRYFKFVVDALLRGDIATRYQAYATGRQWGWLSQNDVREKEEMPPIEGGDEYLTPLNMQNAGDPLEKGSAEDAKE